MRSKGRHMAEILVVLVFGAVLLVAGGIVGNAPPLTQPPGLGERLVTYLTRNVAETHRGHRFPELELPCYREPPEVLWPRLERAVAGLGWEVAARDPAARRLHVVVSTRLWKFKDDVVVHLEPAQGGTEVHIRSSSRVGRGDLGANTRHVLDLLAALRP